jgi:hypothetical protein
MPYAEQIDRAFAEYSELNGIHLNLNEEGLAAIEVDKVLLILRSAGNRNALFIITTLAECSHLTEEKKRELLSVLLDMNCFYSGVGDGVLGKPKDSDDIIYTQTLPVDEELSGRKLHETFIRFADSAKSLKGYLEKTLAEVQNRQGGSSGDPFAMFV